MDGQLVVTGLSSISHSQQPPANLRVSLFSSPQHATFIFSLSLHAHTCGWFSLSSPLLCSHIHFMCPNVKSEITSPPLLNSHIKDVQPRELPHSEHVCDSATPWFTQTSDKAAFCPKDFSYILCTRFANYIPAVQEDKTVISAGSSCFKCTKTRPSQLFCLFLSWCCH